MVKSSWNRFRRTRPPGTSPQSNGSCRNSSAGVSPAIFQISTQRKKAGETPALRKPAFLHELDATLKGKSMFQVSVDESFSAGHALRGYKGKCENPHGHNYKVRIILEGPGLDSIGLLYDFTHLKRVIRDIVEGVDHKFLNDQAPFDVINPSAENLAKFFYDETLRQMKVMPEGARIARVTVWETDTTSATYWS
jgi:6-pyruvoyltetrahydropterin/6-carboxytetrahydropterin synthase